MAAPSDAVLAFVSAIAVSLFGAILLVIKPRRAPQVFFGLFAVLWGLSAAAANLGRMLVDAEVHRVSLLVSNALLLPVYLFLAHFAAVVRRRRWSWVPAAVASLFALGGLVTLIVDPTRVVASVTKTGPQSLNLEQGTLIFPFFHFPLYGAFLYAIASLYVEYRTAQPGTGRHRVRGVLLALVLYVSYVATQWTVNLVASGGAGLAVFASGSVQVANPLLTFVQNVLFVVLLVLLAGLATHLLLRPPPPEGRDSGLLVAFAFPAATATLEWFVNPFFSEPIETFGFWRLVSVAVLVYTLSRYQLFDLEVRAKRAVGPVTAGVLVLFGIPVAMSLASGGGNWGALGITVLGEAIGVGGILVFQNRIREALFPGVSEAPDYLHQRKLELYRVAMEDAASRKQPLDSPELAELRLRYGVTEHEHRLLTWMVAPGGAAAGGVGAVDVGDVLLDHYRIKELIGEGTHGRTFLAQDLRTKEEVAVKAVAAGALDGEAAKLLLREARLAASLSHPNVIRILDVADGKDMVIVVMEYADHGNLEDYLKRRGRLPLGEAVKFLDELLAALEAVHARRIVHRNLKPKNVLIEEDGSVRLADFGAASGGGRSSESTEEASEALRSPLYQSPEQLRGDEATEASDLYVAAVLFHRVLTGRYYLPIAGKNGAQIRSLIVAGAAAGSLDVGSHAPWVEEFLGRALAVQPKARFASSAAMREALRAAAGVPDGAPARAAPKGGKASRS